MNRIFNWNAEPYDMEPDGDIPTMIAGLARAVKRRLARVAALAAERAVTE
jgi:hypothetical protein